MIDIKHLMRIVNKDAIIKQFISHKNGTFQTVGWNPKAKDTTVLYGIYDHFGKQESSTL